MFLSDVKLGLNLSLFLSDVNTTNMVFGAHQMTITENDVIFVGPTNTNSLLSMFSWVGSALKSKTAYVYFGSGLSTARFDTQLLEAKTATYETNLSLYIHIRINIYPPPLMGPKA